MGVADEEFGDQAIKVLSTLSGFSRGISRAIAWSSACELQYQCTNDVHSKRTFHRLPGRSKTFSRKIILLAARD